MTVPNYKQGFQMSNPDHYVERYSSDIRESELFKEFSQEVLAFIKAKKTEIGDDFDGVTWRMLVIEFKQKYDWLDVLYWLTMAIEMMDGKTLIHQKEKIPEKIVLKGK